MTAYSHAELMYARPLASALVDSQDFRTWFVADTPLEPWIRQARPMGEAQAKQRGKTKAPYWFNWWCGLDVKCRCRIGSGIETDVLLLFERDDQSRAALHIEVKRPGEDIHYGQAESYRRRAACWSSEATRPARIPRHTITAVMLVCGSNLDSSPDLLHFDKAVYHDEIASRISPYPEVAPAVP